ncbi:MAG: hypothetical protein EHM68_11645 [Lysobacterales bacterium]|nr:MAG: hypothetical protein EHM68_11645 [Xanthomonadales bacterium]
MSSVRYRAFLNSRFIDTPTRANGFSAPVRLLFPFTAMRIKRFKPALLLGALAFAAFAPAAEDQAVNGSPKKLERALIRFSLTRFPVQGSANALTLLCGVTWGCSGT